MEDQIIALSQLNDFIFCPASIYFHNLYGETDNRSFQRTDQVRGTIAHKTIDEKRYSTRKDVLMGIDVYSEEYGIAGKIDIFDTSNGVLTERKRKVKIIYDGYVFQLYGQYFCLKEMGYDIKILRIYSMADNKTYDVSRPEDDSSMFNKFLQTLNDMRGFTMDSFKQENTDKCKNCIYEPACDRGLI